MQVMKLKYELYDLICLRRGPVATERINVTLALQPENYRRLYLP